MSSSDGDDEDNAPAEPHHYVALAALSGRDEANTQVNAALLYLEVRHLQERVRALEREFCVLCDLVMKRLPR